MNRSYLIFAAALLGFWYFSKKKPQAPATAGSLDSADKSAGLWPTTWPTINLGTPAVVGGAPSYASNPIAAAPKANPDNPPTPGFSSTGQPTAISNLPYAGASWVNAGVVTGATENRRGQIGQPKFQAP